MISISAIDTANIRSAIETLRALTGTAVVIPANETIRDGTRVMLESPEGWFLEIEGLRVGDDEYETLRLKLRGFIYNEKRDILEALTLHPVCRQDTWGSVRIDDPSFDYVYQVTRRLLPAVREAAASYHKAIADEKDRKAKIAELQKHFDIVGTTKKFVHGTHTLELAVCAAASNWEDLGLSLKVGGLTPAQVEALMKVLDDTALRA